MARIVPALSAAGVQRQEVFADVLTGDAGEMPVPEGVSVRRAWEPGAGWWRVGDEVAVAACDIVHVQHEVFLFGGVRASRSVPRMVSRARSGGAPLLMTVHGVPDLETVDHVFVQANGSRMPAFAVRRALGHLIGAAARSADGVIVHEERFAERLGSQYRVDPDRIRVIPHPVPDVVPMERAATRETLGVDRPTALFFGFVSGYKGLPLLLDAWESYRATGGDGELVVAGGRHPRMAGDATYEAEYGALQAQADRVGGVRWEGFLDEQRAAQYLTACDLMVLPYRVGMAASGPLSHALAYGMPVICSDALADAAPDPRGVFAPDREALAAMLAEALDGSLGAEIGRSSVAMGERLTLSRIADQLVGCYQEFTDGR